MNKVGNLTEWRAIVRYRAEYKCERCGRYVKGKEGNCHHKMPTWFMPELKLDIDNGIYLCVDCHKLIHGGRQCIRDDEFNRKSVKEAIKKLGGLNA